MTQGNTNNVNGNNNRKTHFMNSYLSLSRLPKRRGIRLPLVGDPKKWYGVNALAELIVRKEYNVNKVPRLPHSRAPLTEREIAAILGRARTDMARVRREAAIQMRQRLELESQHELEYLLEALGSGLGSRSSSGSGSNRSPSPPRRLTVSQVAAARRNRLRQAARGPARA